MIKAVFFDYDGVLTLDQTGSLTTIRFLSQATHLKFEKVKAVFDRYNHALTLGQTTYRHIWPELCSELGVDMGFDLLIKAFESTPMNSAMLSLANQLKQSYSVGIITDNKSDRINHLKVVQGLEVLFNPIVVSSEVGVSKDNAGIFLHAVHLLGLRPDECVFIDNNRKNLIAPSALGMKTVFHDDQSNDVHRLIESLAVHGVVLDSAP